MNDDFNTAETIACLFDLLSEVRKLEESKITIADEVLSKLKKTYKSFLHDVLGICREENSSPFLLPEVMKILSEVRQDARSKKNFEVSDFIRNRLASIGIRLNDGKDKSSYEIS